MSVRSTFGTAGAAVRHAMAGLRPSVSGPWLVALLALAGAGAVAGCSSGSTRPSPPGESGPAAALRAQIDEADRTFDGRAYDEALDRYKAVYLAANGKKLPGIQAETAAQIATTYAMLDQTAEGDLWMQRAEESVDESEPMAWSRLLLARGMRFLKANQTRAASGTFKSLYNHCILNALTPRAIQAATLASLTSIGQDQLDWSLRAIQAAQSADEPSWESELWSTHAWLLDQRAQYDDATLAFQKARELAGLASVSRIRRLHTEWSYGHGLRTIGQLDDARDVLMNANSIAHSRYVAKPSPRLAEVLGRILWEIAEVDVLEGKKDRARERYLAAREKLVEAGAAQQAPALLEEIDGRIEALDAPEPVRKIPRKRRRDRGGAEDGNG